MTSNIQTSLRVFWWLLWADVRSLYKDFFNNLIDAMAWPITIIFANGVLLPAMGVPANYGAFTTIGMVVIMGAYTAWTGSMLIAADLSGPQTISYELSLPLPYWLIWIKNGLYLATKAATFNLTPLIIGKLILGNTFNLTNFSPPLFALMYVLGSLFFGMFALWSTVITNSHESHSRLELRLIGPMFFLNGWTTSWATMYVLSAPLGIFVRFLPWIYAYEGYRAAALGQMGYINIWLCTGMLALFTILITCHSIRLFKKRMDCV